MSKDDNDGQMIFGDLGGRKLPDICLTGDEKPIETGPAARQARMLSPVPQRWTRVKGFLNKAMNVVIGLYTRGEEILFD